MSSSVIGGYVVGGIVCCYLLYYIYRGITYVRQIHREIMDKVEKEGLSAEEVLKNNSKLYEEAVFEKDRKRDG